MSTSQDISTLIPIRDNDGQQVASGRDLHAFLEVGRDYTTWFKQMVGYGFAEGQDFTPIRVESSGGRPGADHAVTIDMAKELSMIQRTPIGKHARQYFIEVEKQARQSIAVAAPTGPELVALALVEAQSMLEAKDEEIATLEPKAVAYDTFIGADGTYSVGNVAKMLGLSQNKLFDLMRNAGVMIAKGAMRNTPYQKYMHHFAVKAFDFERSDGTRGTSYTTRVQPNGVDFIRQKIGLEQPLLSA